LPLAAFLHPAVNLRSLSSGRANTALQLAVRAALSMGGPIVTWIETVPFTDSNDALRRAREMQHALYPVEYATPVHPVAEGQASGIVASHSLIPDALYHAFATFGVLMSPDLPLSRRQHEMIATMVSEVNRCTY
jgi:hypothetical protein